MTTPDDIRSAITNAPHGSFLTIEVNAGSKTRKFPTDYNAWRHAVGIQVKSPAIEGKANKAILDLIAETLDISKSSVSIASGQTSSVKRIYIEGITPELLGETLSKLLHTGDE